MGRYAWPRLFGNRRRRVGDRTKQVIAVSLKVLLSAETGAVACFFDLLAPCHDRKAWRRIYSICRANPALDPTSTQQ